MRIAQVSPLYESVPPRCYGGTERIVAYLTEELMRQKHEVVLFASGESQSSARLIPGCTEALRLDPRCHDPIPHHIVMLEKVFRHAREFDVIHFHTEYLHYPMLRLHPVPSVTTLHGVLDVPDLVPLYREYEEIPVVSISNAQRTPLPWINWQGTVLHGLPPDLLQLQEGSGAYLAFLGRIAPEKGVNDAIAIARGCGIKLRIAAKVSKIDEDYFHSAIEPHIDGEGVEFIGEINEQQKQEFLGNALALLFPIDWEEPFGLVMIEAMACGTPVIAYPRGSATEVMKEGVTGFLVKGVTEAVQAMGRVQELDRRACRRHFDEHFTVQRMADDYLDVYRRVVEAGGRPRRRA